MRLDVDMKHLSFLLLLFFLCIGCSSNAEKKSPAKDSDVPPIVSATDIEESRPIVHIYYDTPIEGYNILIDWYPLGKDKMGEDEQIPADFGPCTIYLKKDTLEIDITINGAWITIPEWFDSGRLIKCGEESVTLHYERVSGESLIPPGNNQILIFADIDFDGEEELIVNGYKGGPQMSNSYSAYKITNCEAKEMRYGPFDGDEDWFDDYHIEFIPEEKTIISHHSWFTNKSDNVYVFDGKGGYLKYSSDMID